MSNAIFIIVLIILIIVLLSLFAEQKNRLRELLARLVKLENEFKAHLSETTTKKKSTIAKKQQESKNILREIIKEKPVTEPERQAGKPDERLEKKANKPVSAAKKQIAKPSTGIVKNSAIPATRVKTHPKSLTPGKKFLSQIEQQFIDNWTGILGAVILVMGVGFLGIYTALKMSAFFRFLLINTGAVILYIIYLSLKSKPEWTKFSSWIRSASGAIFLFACLGSGYVTGLKWIDEPILQIGILLAGIAVNLYFGFTLKNQLLTSIHIILSLAALTTPPQSILILIIAGSILLAGILFSYRSKRDFCLLVILAGFFVFHIQWYYNLYSLFADNEYSAYRFAPLAVILVTGTAALFVHYLKIYARSQFEALPFWVHIFNWFFLAGGFYLYTTFSRNNTIYLFIIAVAVFLLSKKAKKSGIRWLYRTDLLTSQFICLAAILSLGRWEIDNFLIITILWFEVLIFYLILMREDDQLIQKTAFLLKHLSSLIIVIAAFYYLDWQDEKRLLRNAGVLFVITLIETIFHYFIIKKKSEAVDSVSRLNILPELKNISLTGIWSGLITTCLFITIHKYVWAPSVLFPLVTVQLFLRNKFQSYGLGIGISILLPVLYILSWYRMFTSWTFSSFDHVVYSGPLLFISILIIKNSYLKSFKVYLKWIGIYLFSATICILSYLILEPVSPFIPGVIWLIFSLIYLELSIFLKNWEGNRLSLKKSSDESEQKSQAGNSQLSEIPHEGSSCLYFLQNGYIFIGLFLLRHLFVHLQSEQYIWIIKIRLLIEIFAILVFLYWALVKKPRDIADWKSWLILHPLTWELIILFGVLTIAVEVPVAWHPVSWIGAALLLLYWGSKNSGQHSVRYSRMRFYALFFHLAAAIHIAFNSVSLVTPVNYFLDNGWVGSTIALLAQFVFIYFFHNNAVLKDVTFPESLRRFKSWADFLDKRKNPFIYYPFYIAVGLFIYWSASTSVLTLLWVGESFLIFILSLILKENQFRITSLLILAACLIRLVFYDLARADTITRALVFLGVGTIMLIMNSLYNKYRNRTGNRPN
jgi:Sec-independent protein translocase protein TatA